MKIMMMLYVVFIVQEGGSVSSLPSEYTRFKAAQELATFRVKVNADFSSELTVLESYQYAQQSQAEESS